MYYKKGFLPAKPTNAAMLWSEVEISELQLPFAIERAQELNERFQASLEDLPPEIEREDWEWAYSMVYSRSFVVSESDADGDDVTDVRLLAPFLDLLNHALDLRGSMLQSTPNGLRMGTMTSHHLRGASHKMGMTLWWRFIATATRPPERRCFCPTVLSRATSSWRLAASSRSRTARSTCPCLRTSWRWPALRS